MSEKIVQLNAEVIKRKRKEHVYRSMAETLNELPEKEAEFFIDFGSRSFQ